MFKLFACSYQVASHAERAPPPWPSVCLWHIPRYALDRTFVAPFGLVPEGEGMEYYRRVSMNPGFSMNPG